MLCADVQLALGQLVVLLPPRHLPQCNNDELDLIMSSAQFLEPQKGQESLMGICLCTSAAMKTFLFPI